MTSIDAVLAGMIAAPALVGVAALACGHRTPRTLGRLGAVTAGAGFVSTGALMGADVTLAAGGPVIGVAADRVAQVVLLLIFGVSAVVQGFSVRYLAGDRRVAAWFTGGAGLLTAASAGMVTASTLVTMGICWTAAGAALCLLLGTYGHLPTARDGVRRTVRAFAVGDTALWAAIGLVAAQSGTVSLSELSTRPVDGPAGGIAAVLVVVAALSRSAQIPFHRWLPATLAAPTPVSALLHAGVINAGGILLVRLHPLVSTGPATAITLLAGAATMGYGALIMSVKPDIKGALAHSTMAQMGFMVLVCGLGLLSAAIIHLVAHGFYKATLFLSSGSAIAHRRRVAALPPAAPLTGARRAAAATIAVVLAAGALAAAAQLVPPGPDPAAHALLLFAGVTGAAAAWGWLQRRLDAASVLTAAGVLMAAAPAYLVLITAITRYLAPALPGAPTLPAPAVWLMLVAALAALSALAALRHTPAAAVVQRSVYTYALGAGHLSPAQTGAR